MPSQRRPIALTDADRDTAIDAIRIAAEKRTEGLLDNSRRQHYGHTAQLVASRVAFALKSLASELFEMGRISARGTRVVNAFRQELARACESPDVFMRV